MSINFYYDNITDDGPVPNGISSYYVNKKIWPYPFGDESAKDGMVEVISNFYYSMVKNNCEIQLYTGDYTSNPFSTVKQDVF